MKTLIGQGGEVCLSSREEPTTPHLSQFLPGLDSSLCQRTQEVKTLSRQDLVSNSYYQYLQQSGFISELDTSPR